MGRVEDETGAPLSGVTVSAGDPGKETVSAEDGAYRVSVPKGAGTLVFRKEGYCGLSKAVDGSKGKEVDAGLARLWKEPGKPGVYVAGTGAVTRLLPDTSAAKGVSRLRAGVVAPARMELALVGEAYASAAPELFPLTPAARADAPDSTATAPGWEFLTPVPVTLETREAKAPMAVAVFSVPAGLYALRAGGKVFPFAVAEGGMARAYEADPWEETRRGNHARAAQTARLRMQFEQNKSPLHCVAGAAEKEAGNLDAAIKELDAALESGLARAERARAHTLLAEIYRLRGDLGNYTAHASFAAELSGQGQRGFLVLACEVRTDAGELVSDAHFSIAEVASGTYVQEAPEKDRLFAVPAGKTTVRFEKYGFSPATLEVDVPLGKLVKAEGKVTLAAEKTAAGKGLALGKVTDQAGKGIAGVNVVFNRLPAGPVLSATADAEGAYSRAELPAGDYVVSYNQAEYTRSETRANVAEGENQLPDAVLHRLKKVKVRYVVNLEEGAETLGPGCAGCKSGEAELLCTAHQEPSNGLSLLSGERSGDWNQEEGKFSFYLTQSNQTVLLTTAPGVLGVKGPPAFDMVTGSRVVDVPDKLAALPVAAGDVLVFSIAGGAHHAKMLVVSIEDR
jgi:hypothetical protein